MVWAAGHQLQNGEYIIGEVLGQGGFGITYKALHTRSNTPVVIKTPNEYLKYDPEYDKYVTRFIQEGQRLAQFSDNPHPHIVRFWDLFEEGGIPCMVMDFIPGADLFQLVRQRGALPEAEVLPCLKQIASALEAVHQANLVHRDTHPGNIILRPDGNAILIDFGIAKELFPSTQTSLGGAGNQSFAPYEQISKGSRNPTVDIYCFAATLYYAVTGERPPTSLDRKLHHAVLTTPKKINPAISDALDRVIVQGMALEAEDRPQSIRDWLRLLNPPPFPQTAAKPRQSPKSQAPKSQASQPRRFISSRRRARSIPWVWLTVILLDYGGWGIILSQAPAPPWALVLALVLALPWIAPLADTVGVSVPAHRVRVLAGGLAMIVVVADTWGWIRAGGAVATASLVGAFLGVGLSIVVWVAGERLLKSFSPLPTFLILAGTSLAGLGLGWLAGLIMRSNGWLTFG